MDLSSYETDFSAANQTMFVPAGDAARFRSQHLV
jgi:hypothetical protein